MIYQLRSVLIVCAILLKTSGIEQVDKSKTDNKTFPIIAGLQFQNFALPFKDMGSNFAHSGLFIGSETSYGKKQKLIHQATIGGYANREIGNGLYVSSQLGYRPAISSGFFSELKAGVSFLKVFHPTQAYEYHNGEWDETNGGKAQLGIPVDFGFGYSMQTSSGEFSPYISYQITPALFYNKTLPVNIYTNILIGLRIQL